jgi:hypothetical protein
MRFKTCGFERMRGNVGHEMMRLIAIALLCLLVQGCRTAQPELKQKMEVIRIPKIDFRQANVADVIAFIAKASREYDEPKAGAPVGVSFILHLSQQQHTDTERDRRYSRLKQLCGDKEITLNVRDCSLLNLLDFVTRYVGVLYEFKDNRLLIKTKGGDILVED